MSEEFSIEDVKRKFDEITDTLDSIKTQNAINIGDTGRVLNDIGVKLDNILKRKEELQKSQEAAEQVFKDQSTYGDYVDEKGNIRDNYSTMFGNLDKLKDQMKSNELYKVIISSLDKLNP